MTPLPATVVITTRNRKEDLCKSIASALSQTVPLKVLVIDDGSTDGSFDLVRRKFPDVQIRRSETSLGCVVQRNRAAQIAETTIIVSMDDDAVFSTPHVMETTLREFDHPRVGAVAIPFIDVNRASSVYQRAPQAEGIYATYCFIGTAHALRRDLFLSLGGYREMLVHQGEEEDYCTRMLNAGYITRCGTADPIHHFESPRRSWKRMDYYGARNKLLYAWHNVPLPYAIGHLGATIAKTLLHSLRPDRLWTRSRGAIAACQLACAGKCRRQPTGVAIYRLSRKIKRRVAVPLKEIEALMPPLNTGRKSIP